jgi:hypothetical protein
MRIRHVAAPAVFLALALPAAAHAGTAAVSGSGLIYTADPGEKNDLGIKQRPDGYFLSENPPVTVTPGPGCVRAQDGSVDGVLCGGVTAIDVSLGDQEDGLRLIGDISAPVKLSGGPGTDNANYLFTASVSVSADGVANDGPAGRDNIGTDVERIFGTKFADTLSLGPAGGIIQAGGGDDKLAGGSGDDTIFAAYVEDVGLDSGSFYEQGKDTITCGKGEDTVFTGLGDTVDRASCEVVVGIGGGEENGDDAYAVTGSPHADKIGPLPFGWGPAIAFGGAGNDTIRAGEIVDVVAGPGNDRVIGYDGTPQHVYGNEGNDRIDVRDTKNQKFSRDQVHCGAGKDLVYANKNDLVAKDCERVKRK